MDFLKNPNFNFIQWRWHALALSVLVIAFSLHYVEQSYVISEQSQDPGGLPYRFLLKALIPVGFALLLAQSVAVALACIEKLKKQKA